MQVRHSCVLVYNQPEYDKNSQRKNMHLMRANFHDKKTYSGKITDGAKRRISRTVDILLQASPIMKKYNPATNRVINHSLSFITLTISENEKMLTAKEAYSALLKPFLRYFRDRKEIETYIWKAELQARGQIHYHITTPSVLHYSDVKNHWNYLQRKAGLLATFKEKYGHENPNSTDIHAVRKIKNIQAYLTKYLCKSSQNQTSTTGKLWDCSVDIKGAKYFSREMKSEHKTNIYEAHVRDEVEIIDLENCSIIRAKHIKPESLLTQTEKSEYQNYKKMLKFSNSSSNEKPKESVAYEQKDEKEQVNRDSTVSEIAKYKQIRLDLPCALDKTKLVMSNSSRHGT